MVTRVHKYADGGKVIRSEGGARPQTQPKPRPQTQPKPPPKGDTIQAPKPESAADALRNQRARQMKELGLRDGGAVRKMPAAETRKIKPTALPPPKRGAKPTRIGKR
jgi:hypothetical protein